MNKTRALLLLSAVSMAAAQEGLYDPAPPANSAFVRVVGAPSATLGTKTVTAEKGGASTYVVVPQGTFTVKVGPLTRRLVVAAGKFYTLVPQGPRLLLLDDQPFDNRAKALLTVYNLSKTPLVDLKTADGKTAVITGVKPGASGSRAVNGITVDLAAFAGDKALASLRDVRLERGKAYALVLMDDGLTVTTSSTSSR